MRLLLVMPVLVFGVNIPLADASITYVQSNVTAVAPASTATMNFGSAQAAGDLNVVVISWVDTTPISPSVTDSLGNVYTAAIGPVHYATGAQAIYYAKNIASATAGGNTITVTFSTSVNFLDIRAAEYSGINTVSPLDGAVGATGTATAMSSGSLTTTNANDLLVAGNYLNNGTIAPGTGYTQRQLSAYSSILEDQIVTTTGSYAGTATQNATGWWDMQMAAFKAASSGDTTPPTAPTSPSATTASSSQINLTWTASTDNVGVTGYRVERCQGASCTTFAQVGTPTTTSYSDTGLTASTSYSYRVRATDAAGNLSTYSSTASAITSSGSAPIAYVQSKVTSVSPSTTATVNYTGAQSAGDLNVVVINWVDTSPISPTVTDSKGNTYTAAIGPVHYPTGAGAIYYAKNIAAATAGSNTITVTFSASVNFLDIRAAEYSGINTVSPLDGAVGASGTAVAMSSGSITTTNANDLLVAGDFLNNGTIAPGSGYTQRQLTTWSSILEDRIVSATGSYAGTATQNATGWWDMQMAAFKGASSADTTAPTAPTSPSATAASSSQINVSWTASSDNVGVTGYRVERCQGASCTTFAQIGTPTVTSYSDTGLTASTSYSYRVRATDAAGNLSGYSSTASSTTSSGSDTTPPSAPTGLSATATSSSQISLSWTASTDNVGVTGYRVESCSGASCTTFAQIGTPTTIAYSATGLTASTSYSFRVRATDAAGNLSSYSSTASAITQTAADTTPPTTPGTPSLTVLSSSQINVSWGASTDNVGVTGYRVERCQGTSCTSFIQLGSPTAASYNDTGLTASSSYTYRVRATDAAGNFSSYSGTASATTSSGANTYTYDANGRLSSVTNFAGTMYYHYDAAGNLTSVTTTP